MARTITVEQLREYGSEGRWCPDGMRLGIGRFRRLFGQSTTVTIANVERWLTARTHNQRVEALTNLDMILAALCTLCCRWDFIDSTNDLYRTYRDNDPKATRELARAFCRALKEGT